MLLPFDVLAYRIVEGRVLPSWLGQGDEPFVSKVLDAISTLEGLQVGEAEIVAPGALAHVAHEAKMPSRIAEAIWAIERRRWNAKVDAPVAPAALRELAFELAVDLRREDAIQEAARRLGMSPDAVVGSLFADRPSRRVLVAPADSIRPADIVPRYNLALAQALFARSMEVHATIRGDAAAIVVAAKRDGLLARFDVDGDVTRLALTGPLAIFHDTAKYGRMIARFVPALVAAPSWSLRARVALGPTSADLFLDDSSAIAFAWTIPAAPDGRLARRAARALRAVGVDVDLHPPVVRAGTALVVPDFALATPHGRVLVDVVPFATAEYLDCKLAAIAQLDVPMLVCVDERFASRAAPAIVPFKTEIDPSALYAAALRAITAFGARSSPSPSLMRAPSSSRSAEPAPWNDGGSPATLLPPPWRA